MITRSIKGFAFPHFTEIFTLINLFGPHHVSWWWMLVFVIHDTATALSMSKKDE